MNPVLSRANTPGGLVCKALEHVAADVVADPVDIPAGRPTARLAGAGRRSGGVSTVSAPLLREGPNSWRQCCSADAGRLVRNASVGEDPDELVLTGMRYDDDQNLTGTACAHVQNSPLFGVPTRFPVVEYVG